MRYLLLPVVFVSLGLGAATYEPNNGATPPGTFSSKANSGTVKKKTTSVDVVEEQQAMSSDSGLNNSSGITTKDMNRSPNPAPATDKEVIDNSTLSKKEIYEVDPFSDAKKPAEVEAQAQEESALDYSTTPKKRTSTPLGPNKR